MKWSTGIFLFYTLFVVVLLLVLRKSMQFDNSLVTDNYYEHDLKYQEQYDKLANSQALNQKLFFEKNKESEQLILTFPKGFEDIQGTILFFRPSDSSKDFELSIRPDKDNEQIISTAKLEKGLWRVKVNWQAGITPFYDESVLVL